MAYLPVSNEIQAFGSIEVQNEQLSEQIWTF